MYNGHPYFSLKMLSKCAHYTQQNTVIPFQQHSCAMHRLSKAGNCPCLRCGKHRPGDPAQAARRPARTPASSRLRTACRRRSLRGRRSFGHRQPRPRPRPRREWASPSGWAPHSWRAPHSPCELPLNAASPRALSHCILSVMEPSRVGAST